MLGGLSEQWTHGTVPDRLAAQLDVLRDSMRSNGSNNGGSAGEVRPRIGYLIGTCSPTTRGHLATALQAAEREDLDAVFFILWPFHYIPGFHAAPLDEWVSVQKMLPWAERMELLELSLQDTGEAGLLPLYEAKEWYEESATSAYDPGDPRTAFWTGTWYVIRKLQWWTQRLLDGVEPVYTFVCGEDQFNPNVQQLLFAGGTEKVWKDYSVARQLSLHNLYVVPRGRAVARTAGATAKSAESPPTVEHFHEPPGVEHEVRIGELHEYADLSATQIRSGQIYPGDLGKCVTESVVERIKQEHIWSYAN